MTNLTLSMFRLRNKVIRTTNCSWLLVCLMFLISANSPTFCAITITEETCEAMCALYRVTLVGVTITSSSGGHFKKPAKVQRKLEECLKLRVCVKVLRRFELILTDEVRGAPGKIEESFKEFCIETKGKDNRFCYYIGGMPDSATYILGEMSKPLSWNMPAEKVCEKLHKLDSQICELKYEKQIDLETVDLKKLKVKELKKILDNWGESCDGCLEKTDFIKMIVTLKPKYAPTPVREEL